MRDRRNTNKRAKRSGIKIERTGLRTEPWGTPQVRGDEGEMCGGMAMADVDVRDERYEGNYCSERDEMPNQVDRR